MDMTMPQRRQFLEQTDTMVKTGILKWEDALLILEIFKRRLEITEREQLTQSTEQ